MVLVNTLSCAQSGRACGQREGESWQLPRLGRRTGGQTGRRAAPLSQAKAQNGAAAPVAMETGTEQRADRNAAWLPCTGAPRSHPALTPTHTHRRSHMHTRICTHTHGLGLPAGEAADREGREGGRRGGTNGEGRSSTAAKLSDRVSPFDSS